MFKAPTQTPHFSTLLDDLPTRDSRMIASHLGISTDTLARYRRTGNAPRAVHLALFWESRWGLSVLDCDIINRDRLRLGQIDALERENKALKAQLARLVALGSHGAANEPLWLVDRVAAVDGHHHDGDHSALDFHDDAKLAYAVAVVARPVTRETVSTACRVV